MYYTYCVSSRGSLHYLQHDDRYIITVFNRYHNVIGNFCTMIYCHENNHIQIDIILKYEELLYICFCHSQSFIFNACSLPDFIQTIQIVCLLFTQLFLTKKLKNLTNLSVEKKNGRGKSCLTFCKHSGTSIEIAFLAYEVSI
jgi:hypothetical protein